MIERIQTREKLSLGKRVVIFIGPEGSGKTTQAKRLAEESGLTYVSTGDTIRDLAANDTGALGEACRAMGNGYLAGETLLSILLRRLSKPDVKGGLVLDGGLRTPEETERFTPMLAEAGLVMPVDVVHLRLPGWMSFVRLTGENGRQRRDDTTVGVMSRLSLYNLDLGKRVQVIKGNPNWRLHHANAMGAVGEVYRNVCEVLTN